MRITWLGHSAFLLETKSGTKIITDPYESGSYSGALGYSPINIQADIVTVSHEHADHNYTQELKEAEIVDKIDKITVKDVEIEGILSYHDETKGTLRGQSIIFIIHTEGFKIVHFGDLGTEDIDIEKFKNIDIAMVPVGGTFTLNANSATKILEKITPKVTIPMHFKTSKLGFDIDGVEKFLESQEDYEKRDVLEVNQQNISSFKKIVVLEYQR